MAVTVVTDATYYLAGPVFRIKHCEIALLDIQRPFVWSNARVRDPIDFMY